MENFTIENRYLKLCNEFKTVIRFMKTVFYRPDYEKLLMCPLIKRLGRPSICFETCGRAFETLGRAFETLGQAFKTLGRAFEGLKKLGWEFVKPGRVLEKLGRVIIYNAAHAVPISHGIRSYHIVILKLLHCNSIAVFFLYFDLLKHEIYIPLCWWLLNNNNKLSHIMKSKYCILWSKNCLSKIMEDINVGISRSRNFGK